MNEPERITQTEFGELGNCQSACIAMMLGLPLSDVPNWSAMPISDNMKYAEQRKWLHARGWHILTLCPYQALPWPPAHGFYIAGGVSPRGFRHSVIFKDGKLWHDPHPSREGIVGDVQDVDILVPLPGPFVVVRPERDALTAALIAKDRQIECLRIVLSVASAKANIHTDLLLEMLRETEERLLHEGERLQ